VNHKWISQAEYLSLDEKWMMIYTAKIQTRQQKSKKIFNHKKFLMQEIK